MTSLEPKILMFSPTYEGKDYIFKEFYKHFTSIDYPNLDWMIIDNSKDESYVNKLRREGYQHIHHVPRSGNSRNALSNAQNYARQRAIDGGYDYLFSVESDVLVPKDILKKLLSFDKQVVGAVYFLKNKHLETPCIFFTDVKPNGMRGTRLMHPREAPGFLGRGLQRVHGAGMGCTLLRRDVFSRFMFWTDERFDNKHSDVYYYMELENAGIPVFVDTNTIVEHHPSAWEDVKDK